MCACRPRVNNALGNPLVIEMCNFFAENKILTERRAPGIGPQGILVVGYPNALVRGERGVFPACGMP